MPRPIPFAAPVMSAASCVSSLRGAPRQAHYLIHSRVSAEATEPLAQCSTLWTVPGRARRARRTSRRACCPVVRDPHPPRRRRAPRPIGGHREPSPAPAPWLPKNCLRTRSLQHRAGAQVRLRTNHRVLVHSDTRRVAPGKRHRNGQPERELRLETRRRRSDIAYAVGDPATGSGSIGSYWGKTPFVSRMFRAASMAPCVR